MFLIRKWYPFQRLYSEEQSYFPMLFSICSISSTRRSYRQISFTATGFWLLMGLISIFLLFLTIIVRISALMIFQMAIIRCISMLCMTCWTSDTWMLCYRMAAAGITDLLPEKPQYHVISVYSMDGLFAFMYYIRRRYSYELHRYQVHSGTRDFGNMRKYMSWQSKIFIHTHFILYPTIDVNVIHI